MNRLHDPYLNSVKRTFEEERIKKRKNIKQREELKKSKSFLSQTINLDNIIYLPESIRGVILFALFIFIPYSVGVVFIILTQIDLSLNGGLNSFLFLWTVGYEFSASFVLILLIKESFSWSASKKIT